MMKQFYKRIVTGLALLLILAASLGMLTMAQADTTDSYAFSVDYDPTFCTVKLTYSKSTVTMADGETYYIPKTTPRSRSASFRRAADTRWTALPVRSTAMNTC